jgi:XTP/dITP diphosphohydrolase
MAGEILESPRGVNGFGYDPLFFVESAGRTTAELTPEHKHAISHRGVALRRMRVVLSRSDLTFR